MHPYKNGIIFNHLGNPVDTIAMIFIMTGYLFLKYLELKDDETFKLLLLFSILCPLIKLTYIGAIFFPIFGLIYCKFKLRLVINNISVIGSFLIFLVNKKFYSKLLFLFPFQFTCIQTKWSLTTEQVFFILTRPRALLEIQD